MAIIIFNSLSSIYANLVYDAWKFISEKTVKNTFMKADFKINLVSEVDEPLLFDGLIKGYQMIISIK